MSLNKKITELTELTSVDDNDLLVVVDDPTGTAVTKKIKRSNLVANIQPIYKKLTATGQVAGQLDLTNVLWATSKVMITQIKVTVSSGTSGDFDIVIYEADTFVANVKLYELQDNNSITNVNVLIGTLIYIDNDNTNELHIEIIDNDGTGSPEFDIEIRGWGLN
jgi:hypothetical protein